MTTATKSTADQAVGIVRAAARFQAATRTSESVPLFRGAAAVIRERQALKEAIKRLSGELAALDKRVRDHLEAAGATVGTVGGRAVVELVTVDVHRVDVKALREKEPEVAERFTVPTQRTELRFLTAGAPTPERSHG